MMGGGERQNRQNVYEEREREREREGERDRKNDTKHIGEG